MIQEDSAAMVLLLDIDNYRNINETYGYLTGDWKLVQLDGKLRQLFGA